MAYSYRWDGKHLKSGPRLDWVRQRASKACSEKVRHDNDNAKRVDVLDGPIKSRSSISAYSSSSEPSFWFDTKSIIRLRTSTIWRHRCIINSSFEDLESHCSSSIIDLDSREDSDEKTYHNRRQWARYGTAAITLSVSKLKTRRWLWSNSFRILLAVFMVVGPGFACQSFNRVNLYRRFFQTTAVSLASKKKPTKSTTKPKRTFPKPSKKRMKASLVRRSIFRVFESCYTDRRRRMLSRWTRRHLPRDRDFGSKKQIPSRASAYLRWLSSYTEPSRPTVHGRSR